MANFVLVAGAFHGAWAWKRLIPPLTAQGHAVHRLDLTGQGARVHNLTPATDLTTHITDVVAYVEMEELSDIVLVGHSYSGMVVTGAADALHGRIAHLVYLDAMVPTDGQTAGDFSGPAVTKVCLEAAGGHWLVPCFFPTSKFGPFADAAEEAWFLSKLRPHPMKTFFEPVRLHNRPPPQRTFIYCTGDPMGIFDRAAAHAREAPDWNYRELKTGHDSMLTHPALLADVLHGLT